MGEHEAGGDKRPAIGRPMANTQIYILDEEMGPAPVGVRGELYISGVGVARGYSRRPDLTAESFLPNVFGDEGERLYRTGDVCRYRSDGKIEFVGRADDQVKLRGYRVELGEIEAVLNEHGLVRQSVVVASEDERGSKRLLGYVLSGGEVTGSELKRHVRERLPEYMVPEAIFALEEMPLTANGKIDRKRLQLENAGRLGPEEYAGARTPVEEIVAGIFERVLKIDRVGRDANFFEIGGHSLLAIQVISGVRSTFGIDLGVRSIFERSTVESLSRRIEETMRSGERDESPPLVRVSREGQGLRPPLSFAQQRLWFLYQLEPGNTLYNIPGSVRLNERVNLEALERTINEIFRRHEVLRTRFEVESGEPVQVIDKWDPRRLEVEDLASLAWEEKEEKISRIAEEEFGTGFDLSRGPMLRVKVLKLDEEDHLLLYAMSHIVSDGWSMDILTREVGALYQAYSSGEESPLEELPIQYADFAVWQRNWLQGEPLEKKLEYWRKQLAGVEAMELPADHPRPAMQSYRGASRPFVIEREVAEKLRDLSRREGATVFMTLLGAFDVLMSRYSGQSDIALGTDVANRNRAEVEGLIGFFVNQLVLRVKVKASESFRELLKSVRDVCLGAYANQDVPFEKLVEELQPERDLSRSPLFQVKLTLQNAPTGGPEFEEIRPDVGEFQTPIDLQTAKFDLTMGFTDMMCDLVGLANYNRDLYEDVTIERLTSYYTNLLRSIVEEGGRPVCSLNLLSDREREQIVAEWNLTGMPYPNDRRIHELFERQVEATPEAIALTYENRQLTYAELNARANRLARRLWRLGVGPETLVGVCLERGLEMVVGLLGILKAGGAYVPLDPAYPAERMAFMLEDARVSALLTQEQLLDTLPACGAQVVTLDAEWRMIATESEENLPGRATAGNLAYVIYTSGSTGRPKGVLVPHRQVVNFFAGMDADLEPDPAAVWLAVTSISFDISVLELLWTLTRGFRVVVQGERQSAQAEATDGDLIETGNQESGDGKEDYSVAAQIARLQVTHLQCTPSMAKIMSLEKESSETFNSLRKLLIGGEAFPRALAEELEQLVTAEIHNMYGPTETTIWSATHTLRGAEAGIPIGRPIANTQIYILDRELQIVPIGAPGELYIGGDGVVRGYLERPHLTAERFLPDSFGMEPGARLYRTGDLARYLADGKIEFLGRIDHQVKIRGYRIELGEIEVQLSSHPEVRQCVVIADQDEATDKQLVAYMVGAGEIAPSAGELRGYLKERLPEYMLPAWYVRLEQLPLTPNGKVDRKALPPLSQRPGEGRGDGEAAYVPARDVFELQLVKIWEQVLGRRPIGVKDNFFDLGGHSLLAVSLMARIRSEMGRDLPLSVLFQGGTIERLASILRRSPSSSRSCLVELQSSGSKPPLFFVHPAGGTVIGFLDLALSIGTDRPFYGLQASGLYGEQIPFTRIEDAASHYIEAIRSVQPEGPYFLGGWSLGGYIAFEMAQQLLAQGQRVAQLLLLDNAARPASEKYVEEDVEDVMEGDDAVLLMDIFAEYLPISREDLERSLDLFQGDARIDYVLKKMISANLVPPDVDVAQARTYLNTRRTYVRSMRKYVTQVYPGSVTLFKTAKPPATPVSDEAAGGERSTVTTEDPTMGWGALVGGGVRVIDVPGDHETMVRKPHVETLAMRIRACLDEDDGA
jgi:amino acid adenylation domain-containing protein